MELLTYADLLERPPLEWLVDGIIPRGSLCVLYAPSGVGKSFLALDLAHSVASGRPWLGHDVEQGPGLYVVAEGMAGFPRRAIGWCDARGLDVPGAMRYIPEPVRFHEPAGVAALVAALQAAEHVPALMVVDTLHASLGGGSESDAQDMGILLDGVRAVQRSLGCAVLLIHHSGWDTTRLRGSSSIYAAMDVVLQLRPLGGGNLELRAEKARDFAAPSPITIRLRSVGETAVPELVTTIYGALTPHQRAILAALEDGESHRVSETHDRSGLPRATYYRTQRDLLETLHAVEHDGRQLRITEHGLELLSDSDGGQYQYQDGIGDSHDTGTPMVSHSLPPIGGRVIPSTETQHGARNGRHRPVSAGVVSPTPDSARPLTPEQARTRAAILARAAARNGGAHA